MIIVRFVLDIGLICSCEENLLKLTSLLDVTSRRYGIKMSREKSKILVVWTEYM